MSYIIVFGVGVAIGCILGAIVISAMTVSGNIEKEEEAYKKGFEVGRNSMPNSNANNTDTNNLTV